MSEETTTTPVTAESQIAPHVRENYEQMRAERGLSWDQLAEQFDKDHNGHLLAAWARERATDKTPDGIESRGELTGDKRTADAAKKSKRGNAADLDPTDV